MIVFAKLLSYFWVFRTQFILKYLVETLGVGCLEKVLFEFFSSPELVSKIKFWFDVSGFSYDECMICI